MKIICENSNSSHINANGVRSDAVDTIGQLDTLLPLCTLGNTSLYYNLNTDIIRKFIIYVLRLLVLQLLPYIIYPAYVTVIKTYLLFIIFIY